jgi:hypothetical protein
VLYEFVLSDGNGVVYSTRTKETSLSYGLNLPPLLKGGRYFVAVNTYLGNQDKSQVVNGKETALSFVYEPICSIPKSVRIAEVGSDFIQVSWGGRPASAGDTEYKVRFRQTNIKQEWSEIIVTTGSSVRISSDLSLLAFYDVEVCKICYWNDGSTLMSEWVKAPVTIPETPTLPPFTCGATYSYPAVSCTPPLTNGNATTIFVGGFPIEVQTLTGSVDSSGNRSWSGTGLAPLPFGTSALVKVEWHNVRINSSYKVCQERSYGYFR